MIPGLPIIGENVPRNKKDKITGEKSEKELLIRCPTEKLLMGVVQKLLNEGYSCKNSSDGIPNCLWGLYGEEDCVFIDRIRGKIYYNSATYFIQEFPGITQVSARKFLRKTRKRGLERKDGIKNYGRCG